MRRLEHIISRRSGDTKIVLMWSKTVCERCHAERIAQQPCPECGKDPAPHETQSDLNRRQRIVGQFWDGRLDPTEKSIVLDEVPSMIDAANDAMQRTLAAASRGGDDASDLIDAFSTFDSLIATLEQGTLRPRVNEQRSLLRVLLRLREGWETFLGTLTARTPIDAQRQRDLAQHQLDLATGEFEAISDRSTLTGALQEAGSAAGMALLGLDARDLAGGQQRFADIDSALRSRYGYPEISAGFSAQAHLVMTLVALYFDMERFREVFDSLTRQLEQNAGLPAVLASPEWQAEYGRASAVTSAAVRAVGDTDGVPPLVIVDRLMSIVPRCRDGILRLGLATIDASDGDGIEMALNRNVGKGFASADPSLHLDETLKFFRDAAAHQNYRVDGDVVIVKNGKNVQMYSPGEFLDNVLSVLEVALAFNLSLLLALAKNDIDADVVEYLGAEDLRDIVGYISGLSGITEPVVRVDDSTLIVRGKGEMPDPIPYIGAIASVVGVWANSARIAVTNDSNTSELECSLARYQELRPGASAGLADTLVDMARVVAVTTIDGRCIWADEDWKSAAIFVFRELETEGRARVVRRLLSIRDSVNEVGSVGAAELCAELIRQARENGMDEMRPAMLSPINVQSFAIRSHLDRGLRTNSFSKHKRSR